MLILIASFTEVYVLKFQKQSLRHAHILLTVALEDEVVCLEDFDRLISAEISDQTIDPLSYDTITKFMVYRRCVSYLIDEKC